MAKVKVLIDLDFDTNEAIKTNYRRKSLTKTPTETKEEEIGNMVKERHELQAELERKGWSFKELLHFINKKKYVQPV